MFKIARVFILCAAVALIAAPAFAQNTGGGGTGATTTNAGGGGGVSIALGGGALGAGIVLLGGGFGIGRIGAAAVEGMSRQPEVANNIQTAMIISAALIEGATFFGLVVCLLALYA